jgi:hypothetical protein
MMDEISMNAFRNADDSGCFPRAKMPGECGKSDVDGDDQNQNRNEDHSLPHGGPLPLGSPADIAGRPVRLLIMHPGDEMKKRAWVATTVYSTSSPPRVASSPPVIGPKWTSCSSGRSARTAGSAKLNSARCLDRPIHQMNLNANWISRGSPGPPDAWPAMGCTVLPITPKVESLILPSGSAKFGWLSRLNISA